MPLPHARGGVSPGETIMLYRTSSSPRPWGCFHSYEQPAHEHKLFPTPVGVFPTTSAPDSFLNPLPHARGGVSLLVYPAPVFCVSSPRPWGCFQVFGLPKRPARLFPTPVGVFPFSRSAPRYPFPLPHARGGVSSKPQSRQKARRSSPRPWGCFRKGRERTALNSDRTEEESAAMAASSRRTSAFSNLCSFHALIFAKKRVIYTETKNFN